MLFPRVLDMVDGSFANLFLVGAAFQGLVFFVILGMGNRLQSTSDSISESVMISSSAGAVTESE